MDSTKNNTSSVIDTTNTTNPVMDTTSTSTMTDTTHISSEMIDTRNISSAINITSAMMESTNISTEMADTRNISNEVIDTTNISSEVTDAINITSAMMESTNISTEMTDTRNISNEVIDTTNISSEVTDAINITSAMMESTNIAGAMMDSTNISTNKITNIPREAIGTTNVSSPVTDATNKSSAVVVGVDTTNKGSAVMDSTNIGSAVTDDTTNIGSAMTDSTNIGSAMMDSTNIGSAMTDSTNIGSSISESTNIASAVIDTTNISSDMTNTTNIGSAMTDTTNIASAVMHYTNTSSEVTTTNISYLIDTANISNEILNTAMTQESGTVSTRDMGALRFHCVHSSNVWVSRDGSLVWRPWPDTTPGAAFSSRPLRVRETVCLRVVEETSNYRFGAIQFGVAIADPASLPNPAPEYSTSYLSAALEYPVKKDDIFAFYVKSSGLVRFTINGTAPPKFRSTVRHKVDTKRPFWALVNPWGNCTALQLVNTSRVSKRIMPLSPVDLRNSTLMENLIIATRLLFEVSLHPLPLKYPHPLEDLSLHSIKGRNVLLRSGIAVRIEDKFRQGYVFSANPMYHGQTIVIQILVSEAGDNTEGLAFGLTSCDPSTLRPSDLPDTAEELADRPEYWVVRKYFASGLGRGTEIAVTLTADGAVQESRNNMDPITVMHVDSTLDLWAFVNIYGVTKKVRVMTRAKETSVNEPTETEIAVTEDGSKDSECAICCDSVVDSVLYKCGHSLMCYSCAVQLRRKRRGCPVCRSPIDDVIRMYKAV